jgi:hypothetical protein
MKSSILLSLLLTGAVMAAGAAPIRGDYLEVRSCDIYTGPCFANAEMNLAGKEGMMVWSIREGAWNGTRLDGLAVIAVLKADGTLGDVAFEPRAAKAVLVVDARADARQKAALVDMVRSASGQLISKVVDVRSQAITAKIGACSKLGCASVSAGDLVQISTSCLGNKDHVCGNEETFYPPLTKVEGAYPVFTEVAAFRGAGLDCTWQIAGTRSAFLASFSLSETSAHGADVAALQLK